MNESQSSNNSRISIDISKLSPKRKLLLKKINKMIKKSGAYSTFHYSKSKIWKYIYWIGGATNIIMSGLRTIIDFDIQQNNVIFGTILTIGISIVTFLNATNQMRTSEDAGDKYAQVANDLLRETYYTNKKMTKLRLIKLIETYSVRLNDYTEEFYEPPKQKIEKILETQNFEINLLAKRED
jgi:hypothetical protein